MSLAPGPTAEATHREDAALSVDDFARKLVDGGAFIDVKAEFDSAAIKGRGLTVWRL